MDDNLLPQQFYIAPFQIAWLGLVSSGCSELNNFYYGLWQSTGIKCLFRRL